MRRSLNIWLFVLFIVPTFVMGQAGFDEKENIRNKQRVNYVYNFTDYITWEHLEDADVFRIGVLGDDEVNLVREFNLAAQKKEIKELPVEIIHFKTLNEVRPTEILYLNSRQEIDLNRLFPTLYQNHTLLVSENYPFGQSMIDFIEFGQEFHFNVSEPKINRAGLLISPQLLQFSIQQQKDWEELYNRLQEEKETIADRVSEVESLSKQIKIQTNRINSQREQIRTQQREIRGQKVEMEKRQEALAMSIERVEEQKKQLRRLLHEIEQKNERSSDLAVRLGDQQELLNERQAELEKQHDTIAHQLSRINDQKADIVNQEEVLDTQLAKIQRQGYLIYIFSALLVLIAILAYFAFREYRRKKRSERHVKHQNERLVALNDSLDSFVYRVSHDLKSPVINVKNMISMLKEYQTDDQDPLVPEIIKNLDLSSHRLETTITDLLELSRIERVEEEKEKVNIREVFHEILPEYKEQIERIGGEVVESFEGGEIFYGSKAEMNSILQNLLTNSIKYRSENRVLRIEIGTKLDKEKMTRMTFADNGQGLDLKQFEGKLFGMFQRFTSDTSISGTGVGMYIIKKLVDKNKGKIVLTSEPDNGLKYSIWLPLRKERP